MSSNRNMYPELIARSWGIESLDAFFNVSINSLNPALRSSVRLLPAHYSDHLLKKLWAIARDTKVPGERVRYLLGEAVYYRLHTAKPGKRTPSITPGDVSRVAEIIEFEAGRARKKQQSPELGEEEDEEDLETSLIQRPDSPVTKEADTIVARGSDSSGSDTDSVDPSPEDTLSNHTSPEEDIATNSNTHVDPNSHVPNNLSNSNTAAKASNHISMTSSNSNAHGSFTSVNGSNVDSHSNVTGGTKRDAAGAIAGAVTPGRSFDSPNTATTPHRHPQATPHPQVPHHVQVPSHPHAPPHLHAPPHPQAPPHSQAPPHPQVPHPPQMPHHAQASHAQASPRPQASSHPPPHRPQAVTSPEAHAVHRDAATMARLAYPLASVTPPRQPSQSLSQTPQSASVRPWKRSRTSMSGREAIVRQINDLEYEMKVTRAQIDLDARRVSQARERLEEEQESLNQIRRFVEGEHETNRTIEGCAVLLGELGKLYTQLPNLLGPHADNTVGAGGQPSIAAAFKNVVSTVSEHHDALMRDIEEAKDEVQTTEATVQQLSNQLGEAEMALSARYAALRAQEALLLDHRYTLNKFPEDGRRTE